MIEMAAEANFRIDQLSIQNECLMNQTIDGKSLNTYELSTSICD